MSLRKIAATAVAALATSVLVFVLAPAGGAAGNNDYQCSLNAGRTSYASGAVYAAGQISCNLYAPQLALRVCLQKFNGAGWDDVACNPGATYAYSAGYSFLLETHTSCVHNATYRSWANGYSWSSGQGYFDMGPISDAPSGVGYGPFC